MRRLALILGLGAVLVLAAGAVVLGASSHKSSKSAYKATFHDAYVSGDPTAEVHHGTYKFTISKGSAKLSRLGLIGAIAAKLSGTSPLLKGSYVAVLDAPDGSDTVTGTALIRPSIKTAGTLCATFTATFDQQSNATFKAKTAGGTGEAGTLHASATGTSGVPFTVGAAAVTAKLGAATRPSSACAALATQH